MTLILDKLKAHDFMHFYQLFDASEGKRGVVVTFMGMMELLKEKLIEVVQAEPYGPIHLKVAQQSVDA
jgi:segregation and condensation protein A